VDYSGPSPLATIAGLITTGRNGGAWNGNAITSSSAQAVALNPSDSHKAGLGFAEASALGIGTFSGQSIDTTSIYIRYTYLGDSNLDGGVDTIDFNLLAANFGGVGKRWGNGDFNYDTAVDTIDFNILASNFGLILPAPLPPSSFGTKVPEPAAMVIGLPGLMALRRRSRRQRHFMRDVG